MLSMMAEALPVGAQMDLLVSTPIVLRPLGSCAGIISCNWDIDSYCQDPEWKEVMVQWRDRHLHASVREIDEHELDEENSPFLMLALKEAIQAVKDGMDDETLPMEERRPKADQ
jgi:hypothetical protein